MRNMPTYNQHLHTYIDICDIYIVHTYMRRRWSLICLCLCCYSHPLFVLTDCNTSAVRHSITLKYVSCLFFILYLSMNSLLHFFFKSNFSIFKSYQDYLVYHIDFSHLLAKVQISPFYLIDMYHKYFLYW